MPFMDRNPMLVSVPVENFNTPLLRYFNICKSGEVLSYMQAPYRNKLDGDIPKKDLTSWLKKLARPLSAPL